MYNLPTVATVGTVFMDAALREQCAVKTIWTVYKLNPVKASIETSGSGKVDTEICLSQSHPRQTSYVNSLADQTYHLPIWSGLPPP